MSSQISANRQDLIGLLHSLDLFQSNMRRNWDRVRADWGNLNITWHDEQQLKFEPYYMKVLGTFANVEQEIDMYRAKIKEEIRVLDERRSKMGEL